MIGSMAMARGVNRVLRDYPLARNRLAAYRGRTVGFALAGLAPVCVRITDAGETEPVGTGAAPADTPADVSFSIPLALLPRLLAREESAFGEVVFTGDSEFAALLSELAKHLRWDIEEDLSGIIGDIAAHRLVGAARSGHRWRQEAGERFTANVAEYLTEEKQAFITAPDLETLALANENLRDDVARLSARLELLIARKSAP